MPKVIETFSNDYIVMLVIIMKVVMVGKLNYMLKVDFVLKMAEVSVKISNMTPMRELMMV